MGINSLSSTRAQVADAISKAKNAEYGAQVIVPLLAPLLTTHSLPPQLFTEYMVAVRDVLTRVENWRLHGGNAVKSASTSGRDVGVQGGVSPAVAASWDDVGGTDGGAGASTNGGVPALGLGSAEGGGDSWASFMPSPGGSAGASGASSPVSLRSGGGGASAAAGAAAGMARPLSSNGLAKAGGPPGGAMGRLGVAARLQPGGTALSGINNSPLSVASRGSANGAATGPAATAVDSLAGLTLGGATNAAPRIPQLPAPPALAPPPAAGTSDPFADLYMAQPKPTLGAKAASGAVSRQAAPAGKPAAGATGRTGISGAAGGGDWDDDDWDPFS